jgi:hypothetical protein
MTTTTTILIIMMTALVGATTLGLSLVFIQLRKDLRLRRGEPYRQRGPELVDPGS